MLSRLVGRCSSLWPVRVEVVPRPIVYTDKRPDLWQEITDKIDSYKNLPCTHLPHHLALTDSTWPREVRYYLAEISVRKKDTADLLRKVYPAEKKLVEFASWLEAVDKSHPDHDLKITHLAPTPAFIFPFVAIAAVISSYQVSVTRAPS